MKKLLIFLFSIFLIQNAFAIDPFPTPDEFDELANLNAAAREAIVDVEGTAAEIKSVSESLASKSKELKNLNSSLGKSENVLRKLQDLAKLSRRQRKQFAAAKSVLETAPERITALRGEIGALKEQVTTLKSKLPPGSLRQGVTSARQALQSGVANRAREVKTALGQGAKPVTDVLNPALNAARSSSTWANVSRRAGVVGKLVMGIPGGIKTAIGTGVSLTWTGFVNGFLRFPVWLTSEAIVISGKTIGVTASKLGVAGGRVVGVYSNPYMNSNPYALAYVLLYNVGKLGIYSATDKWISSPPDVLLNGFDINPETREATITYYISVNAEQNVRSWDTSSEIFEQTNDDSFYEKYLQAFTETTSLNFIDIVSTHTAPGLEDGFTARDVLGKFYHDATSDLVNAKTAPVNDLIFHCRLMIYKLDEGRSNGFRNRDNSFEPVTVYLPPQDCVEGNSLTASFSLADNYMPMGDYEAILYVYFHPAVIIAAENIFNGTYDREGWFISNSTWPWEIVFSERAEHYSQYNIFSGGYYPGIETLPPFTIKRAAKGTRTFETYEKVWRHALDNDAHAPEQINDELRIALDAGLEEFGASTESLSFKISQSGLPSNPVYFSPDIGDAYVDISNIIKAGACVDDDVPVECVIYDRSERFERPLTALDVQKSLIRIVKLVGSSGAEEFPNDNVLHHWNYENYLVFLDISPGDYVLETQPFGYGEPIQIAFTIKSENFLVGGGSR